MNYITKNQVPAHLKSNVTLLEFNHNVSYDLDLAQIYLNDFLNGCTGDSVQNINNDYLIIYENESLKDESYFKIEELEEMNTNELVELLDNFENYYYDADDRDSLIDNLLYYTNEDYYEKQYSNVNWRNLDSDFTISGYSQGDAIAVKTVGNISINKDYLSNLFYDAPISGSLEIYANNELLTEIYLDEYLEDSYNWDKVQVINNISNVFLKESYHVLLVEYLTENLPEELEYV